MERIYKRAKEEINRNAERIEQGLVNYIPFDLPRFEEAMPGIQRKNYTIVTANSGIGKSKFTKCLYVIRPVDFVLKNPQYNLKLKIKYYCLEESKESFIQSIYCYKLYEKFNIRLGIKELKSIQNRRALPREIRRKLDELDDYMEQFEEIVEVIDHIRYPYGIFEDAVEYMEAEGEWKKKPLKIWDKAKQELVEVMVNDYFVPRHKDHYFIVITDHISKLHAPKGSTLHETMGKFSSQYMCELRDKYSASPVAVQQQAADQEKKQFTYAGQSINAKLEPSLDGLADNKTTQRDADEVVGLFAPVRYEMQEHRKYNITKLQDNYRGAIQLKARDGQPNARIGLYFDGAANYFEELPPASEMNDERYEYYLRKANRGGESPSGQISVNFG